MVTGTVVQGDGAVGKQQTRGPVIRRDLKTAEKLRNDQKACYSAWGGNRDTGEERGHPSQRVEGQA